MLFRIVRMLDFLVFYLGALSITMSAQSFSDLTKTMGGFQESSILLTAVELETSSRPLEWVRQQPRCPRNCIQIPGRPKLC